AEGPQAVERELPARRFCGEIEKLVELLTRHGLEHREQRSDRLADARGRLRKQAAPGSIGAIHRFGERALALAKSTVRKRELAQRGIAFAAMTKLPARPGKEALAQG